MFKFSSEPIIMKGEGCKVGESIVMMYGEEGCKVGESIYILHYVGEEGCNVGESIFKM